MGSLLRPDTWTQIVVANLVASRLTLLYGESGVGKTSLLQAGVEHQLRESASNGARGRAARSSCRWCSATWQGEPVKPLIADGVGQRRCRAAPHPSP